MKAQPFQLGNGGEVDLPLGLLIDVRLGIAGGIGSALLQLEHIGRKMHRPQLRREPDGAEHLLHRLVGQAEHEIQREVPEARLPDDLHRLRCLFRCMGAPQIPQLGRACRLQSHGDAVEAPLPEGSCHFGGDGDGVGLQGDLGVRGEVIPLPDALQHGTEPVRTQHGGGAAPEIDSIHPAAPGKRSGIQGMEQGGGIGGKEIPPSRHGIEVAVITALLAEGNMQIESGGHGSYLPVFLSPV